MNDPFVAPSADNVPPTPELSEVDGERLAYVHATLAPKLLYALTLGVAAALYGAGSLVAALGGAADASIVLSLGWASLGLVQAALAGFGGVAALGASEASPAWAERALLLELRGWQLAAGATVASYAVLCAALVLAAAAAG